MPDGLLIGGDVEEALKAVGVPSYVVDSAGVIRWINPSAERLVGDVRGRQFTSVVAPEDRARARDLFAQKVLGTAAATDSAGILVSTSGSRMAVEISSVPLKGGDRVVGVFGLFTAQRGEAPSEPHPHLTPRQTQVLALLGDGRTTRQIAAELHLSVHTVRNHVRDALRALGARSRLEAIAAMRAAR